MYSRVLIPLDGSAVAEVVLPHAERLALALGSEIVLLQVISPPQTVYDETGGAILPSDAAITGALEAAGAYLARIRVRLTNNGIRSVSQEVRIGHPADQIIDFAKEVGADLIAMATHGRSGVSRWVYGSVAEKVLRGATTPVLLIRAGAGSVG